MMAKRWTKEIPIPEIEPNAGQSSQSNINGNGETTDLISTLTETVKEQKCTSENTSGQDTAKVTAPKCNKSEVIQVCDVPDGVDIDVPSSSDAPSLKPEPKRRTLFKRNKKKSNQGKLSPPFNKDHVSYASVLMSVNGNPYLFLLRFTVYMVCMGFLVYGFKYLADI